MSPKTPRNVSGNDLIKLLTKHGYEVTRQKGSHIRMSKNTETGTPHITIPNHDPIKLGTLSSILSDISDQLKISKEDLLKRL